MTEWQQAHAVAMQKICSHAGIIDGNVQRNGNHPTAKSQRENRKENEKNALEIKVLEDAKRNGPGEVGKEIRTEGNA